MKTFIAGFFVGAVSLIPGISGGTILFISNEFESFTTILTQKKSVNDYKYLSLIIFGIIIGAISTSRLIEYLFNTIPYETLLTFSLFLLISIIKIIKENNNKFNLLQSYFFIGVITILIISFFIDKTPYVYSDKININLIFLILFMIAGTLDGFITILPGISGSMVMMLLGPYYLYKSLLANLSISNILFLLPLSLYLIGDLFGIYLGSLFSKYMLKNYENQFMSVILGMMTTSTLLLIPIKHLTNINLTLYTFYFIIICILFTIKRK